MFTTPDKATLLNIEVLHQQLLPSSESENTIKEFHDGSQSFKSLKAIFLEAIKQKNPKSILRKTGVKPLLSLNNSLYWPFIFHNQLVKLIKEKNHYSIFLELHKYCDGNVQHSDSWNER